MSHYHNYNFKAQHGCRPCYFKCDCCQQYCSRCCAGINMLYQGDEYRPTRIICENCYRMCKIDKTCLLQRDDSSDDFNVIEN